MKRLNFIILFVLLTACGTSRHVLEQDRTTVEVRTETRFVHDTAWIELPLIIEKVATLDTTSTLENLYAKSEAIISGGVLTHSLQTKPVKQSLPIEVKETVRDSIVYRDRIQTQTVEVEKQLTWWQRVRLDLGNLFIILIVVATLYIILKINLKTL